MISAVDGEGERATQAARDAAAERLGADYAAGAISTDTLEAGVAAVLTAKHRSQLEHVLAPIRARTDAREVVVMAHEDSVLLGRSSSCERVFEDDGVSRRHALLRAGKDGTWRLVDLASTNGTWLNGRRVAHSRGVSDGDEVRLGRLRLTIRLPG
jgi:hypothetical protein